MKSRRRCCSMLIRFSLCQGIAQFLLFPIPAMTGLNPSRTGGFPVELKTAAPAHAAVARTSTFKGWLRRPGEGALLIGKDGTGGNDVVYGEKRRDKILLPRR
jgi:hypothetical protein